MAKRITKEEQKKLKDLGFTLAEQFAGKLNGEPYHTRYKKNKENFRMMVTSRVALGRALLKFFKMMNRQVQENTQVIKAIEATTPKLGAEDITLLAMVLERTLRGSFSAGIGDAKDELKIDNGMDERSKAMSIALTAYALLKAKKILKTTNRDIQGVLEKAKKLNWNQIMLQKELKGVLENEKRIEQIADTENIASYTEGKQQYGLLFTKKKTWLSSMDSRVCPICKGLSGKTIRIQDTFTTQFGEVNGPPAHSRCRCFVELSIDKTDPILDKQRDFGATKQ